PKSHPGWWPCSHVPRTVSPCPRGGGHVPFSMGGVPMSPGRCPHIPRAVAVSPCPLVVSPCPRGGGNVPSLVVVSHGGGGVPVAVAVSRCPRVPGVPVSPVSLCPWCPHGGGGVPVAVSRCPRVPALTGLAVAEFWKVLALLYVPALYSPLLACAGPRHRLGYAAGTLLAWGHCGAHAWQRAQCPLAPQVGGTVVAWPVEVALRRCGSLVALLLLVAVVPALRIVRAGMSADVVVLLVQLGLVPSQGTAGPGHLEQELRTARHFLWALEGASPADPPALSRDSGSNLRALYQGAVLDVFSKAHILRPSRESLVCWMAFSSFQAAFACLGLLIQQVIFFLCSVAFTFLVVIPLQIGTSSPLFGIIRNMWPFWLTLVVAVLLQHFLAHSQFLEHHSLQKEITNRRALYIVTFLLFPTNVLVGVMAAVWRMVISGLYNAVHFCRLDISLLHRGVETFDPGYRTYCHYLKVEVSQCHPLLKAFCFLLLQHGRPEPPAPPRETQLEEGLQLMHPKHAAPGKARIRRIRARWWVAYTLLHNPSLTASRKTALADPTANGAQLGIPRP
uniref:Receptor for retinol uptake STRA6 n=1 Tax=Taeniopygia guttata TaxID=59729 RepID=H0Z0S5_TAEGU